MTAPLIGRQVLPVAALDALQRIHTDHTEARTQEMCAGCAEAVVPRLDLYGPPSLALARTAADVFGVRCNAVRPYVLRYVRGDHHPWHTDTNPAEPGRTVSFSVLLSEPGVDFEGGVFETAAGPVDLGRGDVVAFAALTAHRVTEVTAGVRYALVGFGSWSQPNGDALQRGATEAERTES